MKVLILFSLIGAVTSLKLVTTDPSPYDGLKRFLWSANVSNIEVDVLNKTDNVLEDVISYVGNQGQNVNVLYCDSRFLSVSGSSFEIQERWKGTGIDVLLELSGAGDIRCILGESVNVIVTLKALGELLISSDATFDKETLLKKLIEETKINISNDKESWVFLDTDNHPDMVGYTSGFKKFFNFETNDAPPILLGSPKSYNIFTRLTNYVPSLFDPEKIAERDVRRSLKIGNEFNAFSYYYPQAEPSKYYKEDKTRYDVMVTALFVKEDAPFLDMVLERFQTLVWLSKKRVIMIFNKLKHRDYVINDFIKGYRGKAHQLAVLVYNSTSEEVQTNERMHSEVVNKCHEYNCTWIWSQDSSVMPISGAAVQKLTMFNFSVVAPLIMSDLNAEHPQCNFWGDTIDNGFYKRSHDFLDICERKITGLFVVPYASGGILTKASVMKDLSYSAPGYYDGDSDVVFCNSVRKSGHLLYLQADYVDWLFVNGRTNETVHHPLLEHLPDNKILFYLSYFMKWDHYRQRDWSWRNATAEQHPCTDVYVMPIFTEKFTRVMIKNSGLSSAWSHRAWYKGWGSISTLALSDLGYSEGWEVFSKDYMQTVVHRKYNQFLSFGNPIFSFMMKMDSESNSTELLEGRGVYMVVVALSEGNSTGRVEFVDGCSMDLVHGAMVLFPSRFTHKVRFIPPTEGEMFNIVSFYT